MNLYNNLLREIACQFDIWKGATESEKDWKCRLIYSACGLMGYASSWDSNVLETPSIEHFKSRVSSVLDGYRTLDSDLQFAFCDSNELASEIYDIFIKSGSIYHLSHSICPPPLKVSQIGNIQLIRGQPIGAISFVSGLGTYQKSDISSTDIHAVLEMFQIDSIPLVDKWNEIISTANWNLLNNLTNVEYLNMDFSSRNAHYWNTRPDKDAAHSLLRIKTETGTMYYLYKKENERIYVSRLSEWQIDDFGIRNYSNACLAAHGSLPSITYQEDVNVIQFKPGYLLPPAENNFIKLYSWPTDYFNITSPFKPRKCSTEVFHIVSKVLAYRGFTFEKE